MYDDDVPRAGTWFYLHSFSDPCSDLVLILDLPAIFLLVIPLQNPENPSRNLGISGSDQGASMLCTN